MSKGNFVTSTARVPVRRPGFAIQKFFSDTGAPDRSRSAMGQKQTSCSAARASALLSEADLMTGEDASKQR